MTLLETLWPVITFSVDSKVHCSLWTSRRRRYFLSDEYSLTQGPFFDRTRLSVFNARVTSLRTMRFWEICLVQRNLWGQVGELSERINVWRLSDIPYRHRSQYFGSVWEHKGTVFFCYIMVFLPEWRQRSCIPWIARVTWISWIDREVVMRTSLSRHLKRWNHSQESEKLRAWTRPTMLSVALQIHVHLIRRTAGQRLCFRPSLVVV